MRLENIIPFLSFLVLICSTSLTFSLGKVDVAEDGMLLVDGKRTFIIGSYHLAKSERPYQELAKAGFNLVRAGASKEDFDRAHKAGLWVWHSIGTLDLNNMTESAQQLREKVDEFKTHPALLMWESVDEPAWTWNKAECRVPPEPFIEAYKLIKSIDPNHLLYMNHAPVNLVSTMQKYNPGTDIVACDIYPVIPHGIRPMFALFPDGQQGDLLNCTISQVGEYTDKMRCVAGSGRPMVMVLQGFSWEMLRKEEERDPNMILYPSFHQSRFMAYNAIIHGANGILYWGTSYTPQPSEFWTNLKKVVSELSSLQKVLAAEPCQIELGKRYHETGHSIDAGVEILTKKFDNSLYLITANADKNPVKITLTGLPSFERAIIIGENRSLKIINGELTDSYEPFDVHIYRLDK